MKIDEIRELSRMMAEDGLTSLEVTESGTTIRLERSLAPAVSAQPGLAQEPLRTARAADGGNGVIPIPAPMVGVFYSSPSPGEPPFVTAGSCVHKGDVLCVVEAMKLMNEIVADRDGTVAEVCVNNEQLVEFGQTLFLMRVTE